MKKCCLISRRLNQKCKIFFFSVLRKITKKKMIIDITGILLTPSNFGKDCKGNGEHLNWRGKVIECCCDECNYMMCCSKDHVTDSCLNCADIDCPHTKK